MSRQPSSGSAKYKISNPQPLVTSYEAGPRAPVRPTEDSSSIRTSPARPARSRLREQPRLSSEAPPQLRPLNTLDIRRPSAASLDYASPTADSPTAFSDPFAADRNQRSLLRQQTSDVKQVMPGPGGDKLRNVVGAFMAAGRQKEEPLRRPPRSDARRPQRQENWDLNEEGEFGDVDAVLRKIQKDWPFVLQSDFSPSTLALSLLQSSSSHPPLSSFLRLNDSLSSALQAAVQARSQTFAASLPGHATFLTTLGRAQDQVRESKAALTAARDGFAGKGKGELAGVRARERMVRDMLTILDTIDDMKQVPDQLESLIGDKQFRQAATLLTKSLKTINRSDVAELGALSELRLYYTFQESTLTDILIDELHNHLYLKTYYSDSRWHAYTPGQQQLPENDDWSKFIASLANRGQDPAADENPEVESFAYIESVLEALAVLGKLGLAMERLVQRAASEVHALVETTLEEVDGRVDQRREEAIMAKNTSLALSLDVVGPPHHAAILRDLFWTLYSKLVAVLEGHRVTYEVTRWISSRRDFRDTSLKGAATLHVPVVEVCKPLQAKVRTMLQNYLADDGVIGETLQHMSLNEIIRDGKLARDKQRELFKFANTDTRGHSQDFDTLQQVLKASVPGLVALEQVVETPRNSAKHRNLIPPNAFNVSTLFQPTLAFIHHAERIIPPGFQEEIGSFSSVLEDFVVKVFLPQLDERVTASFQQAVSGYDAFQIDRRLDIPKPPIKSSSRVMSLIHHLCVMLQTTPFHRENYSRLIVGVIVQYYQQCSSRFKELASLRGTDTLSLPATWAQREDVIQLLGEIRSGQASSEHQLGLDTPLHEKDLVNSARRMEGLGQLAESLRWFIDSLLDVEAEDGQTTSSEEPKLPLTPAMMQRFDAIIQTYEQLAEMVLNTMRLEVRGRVICNLGAAMRTGDYLLATEAHELDPDVVDLNASLVELEEIITRTLSADDRSFIFRGLNHLVDHLFIHWAKLIQVVNTAGVDKIKRNIFSVQQCLTGIDGGDEVLARSMTYWDLWSRGPKYMLDTLRTERMFSFDEYNTMLELQCKTNASDPPSSELNSYLIDLHALSMAQGWA